MSDTSTKRNSIDDLRASLFDTLHQVRAGTLDLAVAKTVNDLAKTIVDTAKVEVDYLATTGGGESEFLGSTIGNANLPDGITGVTRHRLR